MKTKFLETVRQYSMFPQGATVVVGLSGGADSMCLTDILSDLKEELNIELEAAHVNHGIRGSEADADEFFVREYCDRKGIKLHVLNVDIPALAAERKESIELCARNVRYEYFNSLGADIIATAHSGSDRIETMLMNLSRGSGLKGLCSIPPVRDNIVRPLISFTREERSEKYCTDNSLSYVTDSSNLTDEYSRNKFRHSVIAEMKRINPAFEKNALRCIDIINRDNLYLNEVSAKAFRRYLNNDGSLDADISVVDNSVLCRVVAMYFDYCGVREYETKHVSFIAENLGSVFSVTLPTGVIFSCDGKKLFVGNLYSQYENSDNLQLKIRKGENIIFDGMHCTFSVSWSCCASDVSGDCYIADADKICDEIMIRNRQSGDVFHLGKRRCSKPLKKIYSEYKIPVEVRQHLIVFADSDGVIFAEGVGIDSVRNYDKSSKNYLIIKMEDVKNE